MRTTFILCELADLATTWAALASGNGMEGNPVAAWCLAHGGVVTLLAYKALATLALLTLTAYMARRNGPDFAEWTLAGASGLVLATAISNAAVAADDSRVVIGAVAVLAVALVAVMAAWLIGRYLEVQEAQAQRRARTRAWLALQRDDGRTQPLPAVWPLPRYRRR